MTTSFRLTFLCIASATFAVGCTCGEPRDTADVTPAEDVAEPATETVEVPEDHADPVSPEVRALIDADDTAAIAADMETRAGTLRTLTASVGERARSLESVYEGMTGRSGTIDPRDADAVSTLVTSAERLGTATDEMSNDIAQMRQVVIDLQAESEALYGPRDGTSSSTPSPPPRSDAAPGSR